MRVRHVEQGQLLLLAFKGMQIGEQIVGIVQNAVFPAGACEIFIELGVVGAEAFVSVRCFMPGKCSSSF